MPTTDANITVADRRECPLCGAPIDPRNPTECPKCDWIDRPPEPEARGSVRDRAAVVLSLVPGLGHFYKGQKTIGVALMAGTLVVLGMSVVFATATVLASLLMIPTYWGAVMLAAYRAEDHALKQPLP